MELEGEQLEHTAKNRKCLRAVKGEFAAHTGTRLQPGHRDVLLAAWAEDRLLSEILCAALT